MDDATSTVWLQWAREIQALSQTGLTFCQTQYDVQRYTRLMEIAAEMVAANTTVSKATVLETFRVQPGYATVKVDVRGAVIRDDKILLVRERRDLKWCMPGGWADVGEMPSEMVAREVREESGFDVKPVRLVGVFDANRSQPPSEFFHAYKLIFLCELLGGEPRESDETCGVEFFDRHALPTLSSHRTNERHLAEVFAHVKDPARLPVFD